jgi:CRP/FNR family transcriptional regulator
MTEADFGIGPAANAHGSQFPQRRSLRAGEFLFREGDAKSCIYHIERGAICTYALAGSGKTAFPEYIYAGDWLGLGYLDRHTERACAVVTTRVSCFPLSWANALVEINSTAKKRLLAAIGREFASVHPSPIKRETTPRPIPRVAEILLKLATEGQGKIHASQFVVDPISYDTIANSISMSVDSLADILIVLEMMGLVEPHVPEGLRLKDIAALEAIART